MLEELNIENIALIEKASLHFSKGLNVLTGETGAGKSILLGALGLLLGQRADRALLRKGAEEASVSALIRPNNGSELKEWYERYDIKPDPDGLILRRTLKENGRSNIYIQSQPVNLQALKELSTLLFDVHGQHQHQSLFVIENHRILLDRFGGLESKVLELNKKFREIAKLREWISQQEEQSELRKREEELAGFAVEEIEAAALKDGEEEALLDRLKQMEQKEQLLDRIHKFQGNMVGDRGVLATLKSLSSVMKGLSGMHKDGESLAERFDNSYYELEDITDTLSQWQDAFDFSPQDQEQAERRLALIHKLQKKYAPTVKELIEYAQQCRQLLDSEESSMKELEEKKQLRIQMEKEILQDSMIISAERKKTAKILEEQVEKHLKELGISSAEFSISLSGRRNQNGQPVCGPHGSDQVEFLFCANRGGDLQPLKSVASGGELSRIMLALKTAFAGADQIETLIFDEIDSGIGGQVALSIGQHFRVLSKEKQIFCITHLASIASFADNHIKVLKRETENSTFTDVHRLDDDQRAVEIARMLAGDSIGELSLSHARELLLQNQGER